MDFLRAQGWDKHIERHLRYGGKLLGICGGFQMLGDDIGDPDGLEGEPGVSPGLGWLSMQTRLVPGKQLRNVSGELLLDDGLTTTSIHGYEIHNGVTTGDAIMRPMLRLADGSADGVLDGAISDDGQIMGCYLHGLFDHGPAATAILHWAGLSSGRAAVDYDAHRQRDLDRLADMIEQHADTAGLLALLGLS